MGNREIEEIELELEQAERYFSGGTKNAGRIVETKTGIIGRTYNNDRLINGKTIVHTEKGKLLCEPCSLKLKGFID